MTLVMLLALVGGISGCGGDENRLSKQGQREEAQGEHLAQEEAENVRLENQYNRRLSGQAQREHEEAEEVIRERQATQNANKIEREASEAP